MHRVLRSAGMLAVAIAIQGGTTHAQYGYPVRFGWPGWGAWGGGSSTVQGDVARGLGVLAVGAGAYNEATARANAINSDTAWRWNQYLYLSQQEANRRHRERLLKEQRNIGKSQEEIYQRLRNNPTQSDITRGDALNVALDEINNPKVYLRGLKGAATPLKGTTIRDIPFQYASEAITISVHQLTQGGAPAVLRTPAFEPERSELKELAAELRRQNQEQKQLDPRTIARAQALIKAMWAKADATLPRNTPERRDATNFLKAAFALTRMLETPAINVLLAGVEQRPDTTVGDLLSFMKSYNLRFGVASTPRQVEVYNELYPLLDRLRDEVEAAVGPSVASIEPPPPTRTNHPVEVFEGMQFPQLGPQRAPAPRPPGPQP